MKKRRYLLGVTGNTGSGKSTVCALLKSFGVKVINADTVTRRLQEPGQLGYTAILAHFGERYRLPDASLDRKALGALVFHNGEELLRLNHILHPLVRQEIEKNLKEADGLVVLDIPLLFESGMHHMCDEIWLVTAGIEVRKRRIMSRDGLSEAEAEARMNVQRNILESWVDVVLFNEGNRDELSLYTQAAYQETLQKMKQRKP